MPPHYQQNATLPKRMGGTSPSTHHDVTADYPCDPRTDRSIKTTRTLQQNEGTKRQEAHAVTTTAQQVSYSLTHDHPAIEPTCYACFDPSPTQQRLVQSDAPRPRLE